MLGQRFSTPVRTICMHYAELVGLGVDNIQSPDTGFRLASGYINVQRMSSSLLLFG